MVNLGSIASFSIFKLTTSSGKHLEDINHAERISPMFKLITIAKDTDDLCVGFDRDRGRRRDELSNIKKINF